MPESTHTEHSVLIVEDNKDDEMLTLRALRRTGLTLEVSVARDGKEATEMVSCATRPWSLLLCDLKLPILDGEAVIKALRSNESACETIVVIFTSSDILDDVGRCKEAGANSFVRKPVDFDAYMDVLDRVVRYWLATERTGIAPFCKIRPDLDYNLPTFLPK